MNNSIERLSDKLEEEMREVGAYVWDISSLYAYFEGVTDLRAARGVRYRLADMLSMITLAKLGGEDEPHGMAQWLGERAEQIVAELGLGRASMPHETTITRVMGKGVDADELEKVLQRYFDDQVQNGQMVLICLDGKTIRGTIPKGKSQGVHLLAAYMPQEGIVLLQVEVESKENEIVAAPKLLKALDLRGKVVVGDALHTQRALSIQIVQQGGDYLWVVKGNQPETQEAIAHLFEPQVCPPATSPIPTDFQTITTYSYGHGRQERRTLTTSAMLKDYLDWPHLEQVFKLDYRAVDPNTGEIHQETVYGLTSLSPEQADPARLLDLKRGYWGIENKLHYRRDVSLNEDRCRLKTGHAPRTMAIINNLALALIDRLDFNSVPDARRRFAAKPKQALSLLFQPFAQLTLQ
jgi:predicted transposase YbfD/YdcC